MRDFCGDGRLCTFTKQQQLEMLKARSGEVPSGLGSTDGQDSPSQYKPWKFRPLLQLIWAGRQSASAL
jgi:hypothetical protein